MKYEREDNEMPKNRFFSDFYDAVAFLGDRYIFYIKRAVFAVLGFLKRPFLFVLNALITFAGFIFSLIKKSFFGAVGDQDFFTGRIVRALKDIAHTARRKPASLLSVIFHYIGKGLKQYKKLFRYLLLLLLPVGAACVLVFTVGHYSDACIALRIDIDGETIGYVSSESDYLDARNLAKQRLNLGTHNTRNTVEMLPDVTYTLTLININQYTASDLICERLIKKSESNIVNACGIYIDGEFLCAVKNEADAKRVFNAQLENYQTQDDDSIVAFVEAIDYSEGLYPDNEDTVWDAAKLEQTVSSTQSGAKYYTVVSGDSISRIADKTGLTQSEIYELNPDITSSTKLRVGSELLIADTVSFLSIKEVKTQIYNEDVDYDTVEIQSDALYSGTSRVVVYGVKGVDQVTSLITYVDGRKVSSQEVARITVKEPVSQRVQVGTKPVGDGEYNISSYGGMLVWPAVNAFNINSDYGYRWGKLHAGLDIGSSTGTSLGKLVLAAAEGTVVISGVHSSYGYYVKIDHGNGMQTLYAHCLAGSLMVSVGDKVAAGQPIARVGMTGYATGPHLHFEVIINGSKTDPKPYLGIK